jgi:Cohesin domain
MIKKLKTVMSSWAVIMVAIVTAAVAVSVPAYASGNANLYIQQLNPMVVGSTVTLQIRLNTNGSHINAIEADITYPTNLLSFVSVDSASLSAFPTDVSDTGGSGSVAIARGVDFPYANTGISGGFKVANVTFNVLAAGTANIIFQNSSDAADATTNLNDLGSMTNASITNVPGLAAGQTLTGGHSISTGNGYRAIMQTDGNFVVYNSANRALWSTRTFNHPWARIIMQTDGNLVVYSLSNKVLWYAGSNWYPGSEAVLQTDGNFVVNDPFGKGLWSSKTSTICDRLFPGDTLYPGDFLKSRDDRFRAVMQTDGNFVVYNSYNRAIWNANTVHNPGARIIMQTDGNLVVYNTQNAALWNSRTYGNAGAHVILQTDSNLVVYNASNRAVWSWKTGRIN